MPTTGFHFYEGSTTDSATSARITVRKGGILVLTKATVEMLGDDVEAVQVGYNPETRAIALRPASLDARGSYRLRGQRNSVSKLVDGKRVFKRHGLVAESSMKYDAESFGDGLVGFTLPETALPETESAASDSEASKPATKRRTTKATEAKS
ncbi:MAG: hypothetical protein AAGF23_14330 [Acidobacteriota bacterium]